MAEFMGIIRSDLLCELSFSFFSPFIHLFSVASRFIIFFCDGLFVNLLSFYFSTRHFPWFVFFAAEDSVPGLMAERRRRLLVFCARLAGASAHEVLVCLSPVDSGLRSSGATLTFQTGLLADAMVFAFVQVFILR